MLDNIIIKNKKETTFVSFNLSVVCKITGIINIPLWNVY